MTTPDIPHHFEFELEVPGTPDEVWQAIATAEGITAWMMPTDLDPRVGGAVTFHMGPDEASHGHITAYEPGRRVQYEEDWATLVGQAGADVTPLVTEFLVEAQSGGTCVVRVVTSAFGTGADWENEFFDEMSIGWTPMLDNLRLYLTHFPGQRVTSLWVSASFGSSPQSAVSAIRHALGITGSVGEPVTARGISGRVERTLDHHFLVRLEQPVLGLLSFYSYGNETGSGVSCVGYLFDDDAPEYVQREQAAWQEWLEGVAGGVAADAPTA
jgi:uncharacterized protein YndB with AHSA1/START domain